MTHIKLYVMQVKFPKVVHWMSIEFDGQCNTLQPEDSLNIHIPELNNTKSLWSKSLHNFSCDNWPKQALLLAGFNIFVRKNFCNCILSVAYL